MTDDKSHPETNYARLGEMKGEKRLFVVMFVVNDMSVFEVI